MNSQRETTSSGAGLPADPLSRSAVVAKRLKDALDLHGIGIPSVRGGMPVGNKPFIELGGCGEAAALALAEVLENASGGGDHA
jgi:hypothetical protein